MSQLTQRRRSLKKKKKKIRWTSVSLMTFGKVAVHAVSNPIERFQLELQCHRIASNTSFHEYITHVIQTEGVRGLWRGCLWNCTRTITKKFIESIISDPIIKSEKKQSKKQQKLILQTCIVSFLMYPFDLFVLSRTLNLKRQKITKLSDIRTIWNGFPIHLCGLLLFQNINFFFANSDILKFNSLNMDFTPLIPLISGILSFPFDSIHRLQMVSPYSGVIEIINKNTAITSWHDLFDGCVANFVRGLICACIFGIIDIYK